MAFLSLLTGALNPVSLIEAVKDENLKRRLENLAVNLVWSQYITLLYSAGQAFQGKFILSVLSPVLRSLAASAYVLLQDEQIEKVVILAVPKALVTDTALLDSIRYANKGEKGTT